MSNVRGEWCVVGFSLAIFQEPGVRSSCPLSEVERERTDKNGSTTTTTTCRMKTAARFLGLSTFKEVHRYPEVAHGLRSILGRTGRRGLERIYRVYPIKKISWFVTAMCRGYGRSSPQKPQKWHAYFFFFRTLYMVFSFAERNSERIKLVI